jgi:hypothetical protein
MTDPFLLTANRNWPMRRFLRKKTSFWYLCWETPRMNMGIFQQRKCLLNIVSRKQISYDFCTSFVLHKVKETFGGSKWKLVELTHVSRYLAYVKPQSNNNKQKYWNSRAFQGTHLVQMTTHASFLLTRRITSTSSQEWGQREPQYQGEHCSSNSRIDQKLSHKRGLECNGRRKHGERCPCELLCWHLSSFCVDFIFLQHQHLPKSNKQQSSNTTWQRLWVKLTFLHSALFFTQRIHRQYETWSNETAINHPSPLFLSPTTILKKFQQ